MYMGVSGACFVSRVRGWKVGSRLEFGGIDRSADARSRQTWRGWRHRANKQLSRAIGDRGLVLVTGVAMI